MLDLGRVDALVRKKVKNLRKIKVFFLKRSKFRTLDYKYDEDIQIPKINSGTCETAKPSPDQDALSPLN